MRTITLEQFHEALRAQGVPSRLHYALKCPMCATVQSAADLIAAGAGSNYDAVDRYLGFSCVGRFTGAGGPRREPDGRPCSWSLGGMLSLHKLEILTPDGTGHPHFEPATPAEAQALMATRVSEPA